MAKLDETKNKKLIKALGKLRVELRKKGELIFYILLGVLLKEIYKRYGVKVSDLFFYDFDEMENLFEGKKVRANVIKERQKEK